jgi:hypothetical protein
MDDICAGKGVAVIDPHGDLAEDILDAIPDSRINEVCYLDAGRQAFGSAAATFQITSCHRMVLDAVAGCFV